jgi:hypothetical protein
MSPCCLQRTGHDPSDPGSPPRLDLDRPPGARMASLRGEIAEGNGSNCTTVQTPCPYTMVGVLRILHNARSRASEPIPLYANLVLISNPKRTRPTPATGSESCRMRR